MRSVVIPGFLAALLLSAAATAHAQDPETPPPPPAAQARERAVPRPERVPDAPQRVESAPIRESQPRREPVARENVPPAREPAARENRTGDEGNRRRVPVERAAPPAPAPAAAASASASDEQGAQRRGAVRRPPSDGRGGVASPRDRAVARTSPPPDRDRDRGPVYIYPDYWSYGRYYDPYYYGGFHLGYLAYSPWGWTPAFYGNPYGYYGGYYQARGWDIGSVRLKVKPRDAEVYVDGYFAGHVDDFDGVFQSLRLDSGAYRIEIRKPGYEPLYFDVRVQPDRTITYRGDMRATP